MSFSFRPPNSPEPFPNAIQCESDIPVLCVADDYDVVDVLPAPRPPQPGFWLSLFLCAVFLSVTQTPGVVVAFGEMTIGMRTAPKEDLPKSAKTPKEAMVQWFQSKLVRDSMMHALAVTEVCVIFFSFGVLMLTLGRDWRRKVALRRPGLAHILLAVVGLPALWLVGNGFYVLATKVFHIPGMEELMRKLPGMGDTNIPLMQELMEQIKRWPLPLAILIIGLGPGIGEELWCRGFLGRGLVGHYGAVVGVAMTSFFFGFIHLDPAQGLMAMLMGVCLHFVYLTTRSLWISIVLHTLNNSLSVVVLRIPQFEQLDQEPERFWFLFLGAAVLASAIAYAFYQSRARLMCADPQAAYGWRPDYPGVEYPPPGSGTIVVHPWPSAPALSAVGVGLMIFAGACGMAVTQF
jgi:membrane protease YdiL (CAAX protease family)